MSDGELKYPVWQSPLRELIHELDREKLHEKINKMETLFIERLQQLPREGDGRREEEAIKDALSTLRIIQRDRLGFPDWK